jgi:hypothetical protein
VREITGSEQDLADSTKIRTFAPLDIMDNQNRIDYDRLEKETDELLQGRLRNDGIFSGEKGEGFAGSRRNAQTSLVLAAVRGSDKQTQENVLKEWAQHNGIFIYPAAIEGRINEIFNSETVKGWNYQTSGMEARIYQDNDRVLKVGYNYLNFFEDPFDYLNRKILLHNLLFPETALEIVGFTETYGATPEVKGRFFAPVLSQPLIQGELVPEGRQDIVDEIMKNLGFEKTGKDSYSNGRYILKDMHPDNIIISKEGTPFFIDTVIEEDED